MLDAAEQLRVEAEPAWAVPEDEAALHAAAEPAWAVSANEAWPGERAEPCAA